MRLVDCSALSPQRVSAHSRGAPPSISPSSRWPTPVCSASRRSGLALHPAASGERPAQTATRDHPLLAGNSLSSSGTWMRRLRHEWQRTRAAPTIPGTADVEAKRSDGTKACSAHLPLCPCRTSGQSGQV